MLLGMEAFRRALVTGPLVAVCAALLGVYLVTGNMSAIGDGLSHVAFGGAAVGLAAGAAPLYTALPAVTAAALILLLPRRSGRKVSSRADAVIGALAGGALALGVMVVSVVRGVNTDVESYLFGSILTLSAADTAICAVCSAAVILFFALGLRKLFAASFDPDFAEAVGIRVRMIRALVALLTAVTVVVALKVVGAMLVSGLMIFPVLSALRFTRSFRGTVIFSAVSAVIFVAAGLTVSVSFGLPAGASIVAVGFAFYIVCSAASYAIPARAAAGGKR